MFAKLIAGAVLAAVLPGTCDVDAGLSAPLVQDAPASFMTGPDLGLKFARSEQLLKEDDPPEGPGGVDPPSN